MSIASKAELIKALIVVRNINTAIGMGFEAGYDVSYRLVPDSKTACTAQSLADNFKKTNGVTSLSYNIFKYASPEISAQLLSERYKSFKGGKISQNGTLNFNCTVLFVDDDTFKKLLSDNNLNEDEFMNPEKPLAVACGFVTDYDSGKGSYISFDNIFTAKKGTMTMTYLPDTLEGGYKISDSDSDDGSYVYENEAGDKKIFTENEVSVSKELNFGAVIAKLPFPTIYTASASPSIIYPYSAYNTIWNAPSDDAETSFMMSCSSPDAAYGELEALLGDMGLNTARLNNHAKSVQSQRALALIVNVFAYGFIVLISLIAVANVFNTISTNVLLRRREFAMLKSVGMTNKAFRKMMNYECLLYGVKGLLYGIPVAIVITYFISEALASELQLGYILPWQSIIIAVVSVFAVVFITMLYSMSKMKNDNTIEALRNENM